MTDSPQTPLGRFCWHEIMTRDPDAARDFYRTVAGWGTSVWDGGDEPYQMWMNGERPLGGLLALPAPEVPPCWMAYISTPDRNATLARVRALGGSVMNEIEVPEVGRFAVIADPQGGVFAVLEPEGETPGHDEVPVVGDFSWNELATTDADAAWSFYSELFGWEEAGRMDMGEMGMYRSFGQGAHPIGGIFHAPEGMPAGWLHYIRVPDVAAALESVKALGGRILNGPMDVPGGDRVAQCMDAHGIAFALHATVAADEESAGQGEGSVE